MTHDQIVEAINALTDEATIAAVREATKNRVAWAAEEKRKRQKAERDALDKDTMQRISGWKNGTVVYFGRPFSRGHMYMEPLKVIHIDVAAGFKATVHSVQPRAYRVWLKLPGKKTPYRGNLLNFSADDIRRYDISRTELAIRQSA